MFSSHHNGHWSLALASVVVLATLSSSQLLTANTTSTQVTGYACQVFCNFKILHTIQMAQVFNDSKYFVDMKLKLPPEEVEKKFTEFLNVTKNKPSKDKIKEFVQEHFDEWDSEFVSWIPKDWKSNPRFLRDVYDMPLKNWVRKVIARWKSLGRKLSDDVKANGDRYSQIYVPKPFIIPGGRFKELYYWDSYWIIEGLLISEMYETAKGMIENFLYLVNKLGYVPNGTRKYYIGRSQPPFLTSMVNLYWQYTKDLKFLNESMVTLEKEYNFWHENRSVDVYIDNIKYRVFLYNVTTMDPRPESFKHDEDLVKGYSQEERSRIFSGLKSAAESGWDFSSRWFLSDGERTGNITDVNTMSVAPVCLNSLLGLNAQLLSQFYAILGNKSKSEKYKSLARETNITMSRVFWSDRDGVWLDYNLVKKELIPGFYASNLMPLWTETYGTERSPQFIIEQCIAYLDRSNITNFPGGIPTSTFQSGEQWDYPLGWAPLQYLIVMGLHKAGRYSRRADSLAFRFARRWVLNVYLTYLNTTPHEILEKYKVTEIGTSGEGGEYTTQVGFGWTNGVVIKFLSIYGHRIKTREIYDAVPMTVGIILVLVSLVAIVSYMHRNKVFKRIRWEDEEEEEQRNTLVP